MFFRFGAPLQRLNQAYDASLPDGVHDGVSFHTCFRINGHEPSPASAAVHVNQVVRGLLIEHDLAC